MDFLNYSQIGMVEEIDGYVSPQEAARRLSVTVRRIHRLVADGSLRCARAGNRVLVRRDDVEARAQEGAAARGRPFSPRRAWAIILLASNRDVPGLDPVTRAKLRKVVAQRDLWSLRSRLRRRAERRELHAHSSDLLRIANTPSVVATGPAAAGDAGLPLMAPEATLELYVDERTAADLEDRYLLRPSRNPNLVLRVLPPEARAWLGDERVAPRVAVALDLAEDLDPRAQQVARDALLRR